MNKLSNIYTNAINFSRFYFLPLLMAISMIVLAGAAIPDVHADHQYCNDGTEVPHGAGPPGYSEDFCEGRDGVDVPQQNTSDLGSASDLGIPDVEANESTMDSILDAVFMIVGALSVIFVIVGGLKYVLSAGNPESAQKAKNTIMYALIGLAVTVFAYAIVNFVITNL